MLPDVRVDDGEISAIRVWLLKIAFKKDNEKLCGWSAGHCMRGRNFSFFVIHVILAET